MRTIPLGVAVLLTLAGAAGAAETVKVAAPISLSGVMSTNGERAQKGLDYAAEIINASGGILGSNLEFVKADDAGVPANANTITRNMILNDGVKAIFGGTNSATALAEQALARQFKLPFMIYLGQDVALTSTNFNVYSFQVQSSSYMEPRAVAGFVKDRNFKKIFTIAPDYGFGRSYVSNFAAGMREMGSTATIVGEQYPALGTTDYTNYISAAIAAEPDFLFLGLFAGDLVSFVKQAKAYGLFDKMVVGASTAADVVMTLKEEVPPGMILWGKTPFFAMKTPGITEFAEGYYKRFGEWPSEWPVLIYAAVQSWKHGVETAQSFDGEKVAASLSGATVSTVIGNITFRTCDHQADVPVYVGTASEELDPRYGFRTLENVYVSDPPSTMMSCEAAQAGRR